jgi:hypothetical protein
MAAEFACGSKAETKTFSEPAFRLEGCLTNTVPGLELNPEIFQMLHTQKALRQQVFPTQFFQHSTTFSRLAGKARSGKVTHS